MEWARYIASEPELPTHSQYKHVAFNENAQTGILFPATEEHAFLRKRGDQWLVCPWRVKLRVLVGMLAYRTSIPDEAADLWVPEEEALKAAGELEQLRLADPELRANINTASWHVPLRWFMIFDDSEKIVKDVNGRIEIRYETDLRTAKSRIDRGLRILRNAGMADSQCEPVADLAAWIDEFPYDSMIELDYGSVATLFKKEDLLMDRSAAEMWSCLEALALSDYEDSAVRYNDLASWWNRVRALESAN